MSIENTQGVKVRSESVTVIAMRIILIVLFIINLYPLLFVVFTSFKTTSEFLGNIWALPKNFNFANYALAWVDGHIGEYFFNSVVVTTVSLLFIIVFASFASYALARLEVPFAKVISAAMMIVIILPTESMIIPLYITMVKMNIINVRFVPMIFAYIGWCMPFAIVVLKNFFTTIPNELLEAGRIDGCNELQTLFRIVAPLMVPAIGTCLVFNFCYIWGELMWAQISTSSVDYGMTLTSGIISFQGQYETDWGPMTAGICIVLIPLFVVFLFLQKYFIQGLTAGAVKG